MNPPRTRTCGRLVFTCCWPPVHFVILGTYSDRCQPRRAVEICEMSIVTPTQLPWEDILSWNEGFLLLLSKLAGMLRTPTDQSCDPCLARAPEPTTAYPGRSWPGGWMPGSGWPLTTRPVSDRGSPSSAQRGFCPHLVSPPPSTPRAT